MTVEIHAEMIKKSARNLKRK